MEKKENYVEKLEQRFNLKIKELEKNLLKKKDDFENI